MKNRNLKVFAMREKMPINILSAKRLRTKRIAARQAGKKEQELIISAKERQALRRALVRLKPSKKPFVFEDEKLILNERGEVDVENSERALPAMRVFGRTFVETPKGKFVEITKGTLKLVYEEDILDRLHLLRGQHLAEHARMERY